MKNMIMIVDGKQKQTSFQDNVGNRFAPQGVLYRLDEGLTICLKMKENGGK